MSTDLDVTPLCEIYTGGLLQQQQHSIYDESFQILQAQQQGVSPEPSTGIFAPSFLQDDDPYNCS